MNMIAPSHQPGTVLVAVKAAARRLRRWPLASLDCDCARCLRQYAGRDEETLLGRTKKLLLLPSSNNAMHTI